MTPGTTVIIPAYRARATLGAVLTALRPQVERTSREVVVVDSTGDGTGARLEREFPWARIIALEQRTLPGRARNLGVRASRGGLLAFLDADAVPAPGWLDALEAAHHPRLDMVAGAVENGTPASAWGSAGHLLEFLDWLPDRSAPLLHAVTCNLLVTREVWGQAGGFPEDLWPGEDTLFTLPCGRAGRLGFAPGARVRHLNRTAPRAVLAHQRRLGAAWVTLCRRTTFPGGWLARPGLAPLAVLARVLVMALGVHRRPAAAAALARHAPRVLLGLTAWGVGVGRGACDLDRPGRERLAGPGAQGGDIVSEDRGELRPPGG